MTAMNCPVCNAAFRESLHDGILIDICTQCRGVWLDRGELEKLLSAVKQNAEPYRNERDDDRDRRYTKEHRRDDRYEETRYRKRDDDDDDDDDRRGFFGGGSRHADDRYRKRSKLEGLFGMFD